MNRNISKSVLKGVLLLSASIAFSFQGNAQQSVSEMEKMLKNTYWLVDLPDGKNYVTELYFGDGIYKDAFIYKGVRYELEFPYEIEADSSASSTGNNGIGYSLRLSPSSKPVKKFQILNVSSEKLTLKNLKTGVIINCTRRYAKE